MARKTAQRGLPKQLNIREFDPRVAKKLAEGRELMGMNQTQFVYFAIEAGHALARRLGKVKDLVQAGKLTPEQLDALIDKAG